MESLNNQACFNFLIDHFERNSVISKYISNAENLNELVNNLWVRTKKANDNTVVDFFNKILNISPTQQIDQNSLYNLQDVTFNLLNRKISKKYFDVEAKATFQDLKHLYETM